jgi:L-lactate utilization protein LutC
MLPGTLISVSGTIGLDAAADQGRRALTLIPDLHVCVMEAGRIVASLLAYAPRRWRLAAQ